MMKTKSSRRRCKKLVCIVLIMSMVLTIVGCSKSPGNTDTDVSDNTEKNVDNNVNNNVEGDNSGEEPQYGGKLTVVNAISSRNEPTGWDVVEVSSVSNQWYLSPVLESLMGGDILGKGPRGTNESSFNTFQAELPESLLTGQLVEDWEYTMDPLGATLKVRDNVYWTANKNIGMESRKVTAEDIAYHINRYRSSSKASKMSGWTDENPAMVVDENTVFVSFSKPFASWAFVIAYALYNNVYPKEMVEADPNKWQNVVGTGPFILSNYVEASHVSYTKNDSWWNSEQTIDGKTYEAPFIDELVLPIMPDESVQISAIRTGQVDIMAQVSYMYKETLESSCPDLNIVESSSGNSINLRFNSTNGPCMDVEFRRALMLGTNNDDITNVIPGATTGGYPFGKSLGESVYTPIEKLPDDVKALYSYDPAAAKARIAELGYAGETMVINYVSTSTNNAVIAELLADQWKELGIVVELNVVDAAVFSSYDTGDGSGWSGVMIKEGGNSKTSRGIENARTFAYLAASRDEYFNELMDTMMAETDGVKRDALMKDAAVYFIGTVDEFGLCELSTLTCYWPWVKNYYGETEAGSFNMAPVMGTLWIDQELKSSMGY